MTNLNKRIIYKQEPNKCKDCGNYKELRPYGKNGMNVCFTCAMKDEDNAKMQLKLRLNNNLN